MTNVVLPIFYFPPISWFAQFLNESNEVELEVWEHFTKQTYRNRTDIYAANGKLSLIIPVQHSEDKLYRNTQISYRENWQKQHWKSIESAYKNSPYFEFYEHQLKEIFAKQPTHLLEFNLHILQVLQKIMKQNVDYKQTESYQHEVAGEDFRSAFSAKKASELTLPFYYQVFTEKHGFINDLSILDLICNLGPEISTFFKTLK